MALADTVPVSGPVPEPLLPPLALALLISGILFSAMFYIQEETGSGKQRRTLFEEASLAGSAAGCLGFGTVFLLLWCGVYLG